MASRVIFSPLRSKRDRISPKSPRATASGFTIIKVFSHSLIASGRRPHTGKAAAPTSSFVVELVRNRVPALKGPVPSQLLPVFCPTFFFYTFILSRLSFPGPLPYPAGAPSAFEGAGHIAGEVGNDDVRARPLHGREHFEDHRLFVDPAREGRGLHQGV